MSRKVLLCHIMKDNINEVGIVKTKVYAQEFSWKKRMWAIDKEAVAWIDRKGRHHLFVDVNESDGTIRFLNAQKTNIIDDTCVSCGGKISVDARNVWDLLKRKTITTFWGVDQSHIVLLMIMGIISLIAIAGIMYLLGQNTKLQEQLITLIPSAKAVIGVVNH